MRLVGKQSAEYQENGFMVREIGVNPRFAPKRNLG